MGRSNRVMMVNNALVDNSCSAAQSPTTVTLKPKELEAKLFSDPKRVCSVFRTSLSLWLDLIT